MSSHTSLSAAADDRKARLAKLKSLKRKQPADELASPESTRDQPPKAPAPTDGDTDATPEPQEPDVASLYLSGRNYDTTSKAPKLGFESAPTLPGANYKTLEQEAAEVETSIKAQAAAEQAADADKGIDLFKLQPKRPNWDLKRELNKKLEVLNVRTDNAIARMVAERLRGKKDEERGKANGDADGKEVVGMNGKELDEMIRLREKEGEEAERREREELEV